MNSKIPAPLRNKLLAVVAAAAVATGGALIPAKPPLEVELAMAIGAEYESSNRHIGVPYVDKAGRGQPLTVCNGVTGKGVVPGKVYTKDDCYKLELERYIAAYKWAKANFKFWAIYNPYVRASFIDMVFNLGAEQVAGSSMLRLANAGNLIGACTEQPKWVFGRVNGALTRMGGLESRRGTTNELCVEWGQNGHFSTEPS